MTEKRADVSFAARSGWRSPRRRVRSPALAAVLLFAPAMARGATADPEGLRSACDGGSIRACHNLALATANGDGTPKDLARAAQLYEKACAGGHAGSCLNLANLLAEGKGVGKDPPRAAELWRRACDGGAGEGCFQLGRLAQRAPARHTMAADASPRTQGGRSA